jgi:hypothetical protein
MESELMSSLLGQLFPAFMMSRSISSFVHTVPTHGYWHMSKRPAQMWAGKKSFQNYQCEHVSTYISCFKLEGGWRVGVRAFTYM